MNVWIFQENPNNDYTPAEKWGEVKFVTGSDLKSWADSPSTKNYHQDVKIFLRHYKPNEDFIIVTGNPVAICHLGMVLPVGHHRFLKWDHRAGEYVMFRVIKEELNDE